MTYLIIFITVHSYLLTTNHYFPESKMLKKPASDLSDDLKEINNWAVHWKMRFNLDPSKQAQKFLFGRKILKTTYPQSFLRNIPILLSEMIS